MKSTILILSNDANYTYNLRRELILQILTEHRVILVLPDGPEINWFREQGCLFFPVQFKGRGLNPFSDLKLFFRYLLIIIKTKPDIVLSYTIKPNIYGGLICKLLSIPIVANITGLGTAIEQKSLLQHFGIILYRLATGRKTVYFFQNKTNQDFFISNRLISQRYQLIPGSGVNTEHFNYLEYPQPEEIRFCYMARIMKEKGIELYLRAAENLRNRYPNARFLIVGRMDEQYRTEIDSLQTRGIVDYRGEVQDIRTILKDVHCLVHPSYYPEGISNVLLESAACGRPLITSDRPGCRETLVDRQTGFLFKSKDTSDLIAKMEQMIQLDPESRQSMGIAGREYVKGTFSRQFVIDSYIDEINYQLNHKNK